MSERIRLILMISYSRPNVVLQSKALCITSVQLINTSYIRVPQLALKNNDAVESVLLVPKVGPLNFNIATCFVVPITRSRIKYFILV